MKLHSVREGWRIAIDQLRANKMRSALTVLGVVIGIATVMAMASIVAGFREQIVNTLEVVGPTTFRVLRYFSTTGVNPDAVPREVRIRPKLVPQDADAIARLPEIHYAAIWTQVFQRFEYGGNHTRILGVFGADDRFMEILGGGISSGRSFTAAELRGVGVLPAGVGQGQPEVTQVTVCLRLEYDRLLEVVERVTEAARVEHADAGHEVLVADRPRDRKLVLPFLSRCGHFEIPPVPSARDKASSVPGVATCNSRGRARGIPAPPHELRGATANL